MNRLVAEPTAASDQEIASWYAFGPGVTVRSNMIMSADGLAVGPDGLSKSLSGTADGNLLGILRAVADAVVVAAGTLRNERYNPIRTRASLIGYRAAQGLAAHPRLVMVTREPKVDDSYRALAEAPVRPLVLCARDSGALASVADVEECPGPDGGVDLAAGVALLAERGLTRLHTEGGPRLLGGLIAAGLLQEYCLTIAPRTYGGQSDLRPVVGPVAPADFTLEHSAMADDYLFLMYRKALR